MERVTHTSFSAVSFSRSIYSCNKANSLCSGTLGDVFSYKIYRRRCLIFFIDWAATKGFSLAIISIRVRRSVRNAGWINPSSCVASFCFSCLSRSISCCFIYQKQQHIRQPFMVDKWVTWHCVGKRVCLRYAMCQNNLPHPQMPPKIRIKH